MGSLLNLRHPEHNAVSLPSHLQPLTVAPGSVQPRSKLLKPDASNSNNGHFFSWNFQERETPMVLQNVKRTKLGSLDRKPRDLLLPYEQSGVFQDTVLTSTLDGNIQVWNMVQRRLVDTIPSNALQNNWSENIVLFV